MDLEQDHGLDTKYIQSRRSFDGTEAPTNMQSQNEIEVKMSSKFDRN